MASHPAAGATNRERRHRTAAIPDQGQLAAGVALVLH